MKIKLNIDEPFYKERVQRLIASCKSKADTMLLLGADMSGIQSYLYQIISTDALKNLKGRSFFLRMLPDAIVRYMLQELRLDRSHVLYNSGGCFYLLLPQTEFIEGKLPELYAIIEQKLFDAFHNALYVAFAHIPLTENELNNETILKNKWDELFLARAARKNARFAQIIKNNYEQLFEPSKTGGEYKIDVMTGEEIIGESVSKEDGKCVSKSTEEQIELGKELKTAVGMLVSGCKYDIGHCYEPLQLGVYYYILDNIKLKACQAKEYKDVYVFNEDLENIEKDELYFYGGGEDNTDKLSELVDKDGLHKLGVVRMDVDNLGFIFQNSGKGADVPFSKTIALSRQLDYFFSGYINLLVKDGYKDSISIVYSGGDDVFFVGGWSACLEFAEKIADSFEEFVNHDKQYSISGGISIVKEKFPLLKAAEYSGEEEENAKKHICRGEEKNSFSLMGYALNWGCEYKAVKELKDELVALRDRDMMDAAFLQYIMQMAQEARIKEHKITNYKVFWLLAYGLSRLCTRNSDADLYAKNILKDLNMNTLNGMAIKTDYHSLELWSLACRWAEFETRK